MTSSSPGNGAQEEGPRRSVVAAERTFRAPAGDLWRLWTSREGLESFWGPQDFRLRVRELDPREGGGALFELRYAAAEGDARRAEELRAAGIPVEGTVRWEFVHVVPGRSLVVRQRFQLGARAPPSEVELTVELRPVAEGVTVALSAEGAPTGHFRVLARTNLQGQLERMAKVLGEEAP